MKSGAPISVDDVSAVMQQAGLPPLQPGQEPAAPPPLPVGPNGQPDSGTQPQGPPEPPQSAV